MGLFSEMSRPNALVVGASRGIGLGFVKQLLARPDFGLVFAGCRSIEAATDLLALQQDYGDRLHLIPLDTTDETQLEEAAAKITGITANLHLIMNCVGWLHDADYQPEKALRQINSEQLLRYFQVNSISAALLAKHFMGLLKHSEPSLFASISAKVGSIGDNELGGWYGYRASKVALNMLMKTSAIEYSRRCPNAILVSLHPGTTDTGLSMPFQKGVPPEKLFTVERSVGQLLGVLDGLTPADSGGFFSWDGSRLPW
jgi:NAD(P)-dependent dehydrogenase (short-subunit alcohol dehydrogenase family)